MDYSFPQEKGMDYHHCMALGELLSLSGPQFPHYCNYGGKPVAPKYGNWAGCSARRDWGQEEKETTEDEMAGWHHRLHAREFE